MLTESATISVAQFNQPSFVQEFGLKYMNLFLQFQSDNGPKLKEDPIGVRSSIKLYVKR